MVLRPAKKKTNITEDSKEFKDVLQARGYENKTHQLTQPNEKRQTAFVDRDLYNSVEGVLSGTVLAPFIDRTCLIIKNCYYEKLLSELNPPLIDAEILTVYQNLDKEIVKISFLSRKGEKATNLFSITSPKHIRLIKSCLAKELLDTREAFALIMSNTAYLSTIDRKIYHYYLAIYKLDELFAKSQPTLTKVKRQSLVHQVLTQADFIFDKEERLINELNDTQRHRYIKSKIKYFQKTGGKREQAKDFGPEELEKFEKMTMEYALAATEFENYIKSIEEK